MPGRGDPLTALATLLAGLALFAGAGAGLLGLLGRAQADEDDPGHLGWCFLAGSALAGLLLYVPLAIGGRLPRPAFLLVFLLFLVLAAGPGRAHVRKVGLARFLGLDVLRALPVWLRVAAVALVVLAGAAALGPFSAWDERAIFGLKARVLVHDGGLGGEAFADPDYVHSQARYPLLVPLLEAALLVLRGSLDDRFLRLLFLAFALSLAAVVAGEARRLHAARAGGLWGLLLLSTPMLVGPAEGSGLTGYADVPLAAFVTGATVLLGRALERDRPRPAPIAGLLLGAALATKQEGALWAAALALGAVLVVALRRRDGAPPAGLARSAAVSALPTLLFLALVAATARWIPASPWSERYAAALRPDWLLRLGARPLEIAPFVLGQLADRRAWAWGWLLVVAGLLLLRRPRLSPAPFLWRATAVAVLAADLGVFVVTPNQVHWHLATAFSRLLLQLFPLAVLILAEQVGASGWPAPGSCAPAPAGSGRGELAGVPAAVAKGHGRLVAAGLLLALLLGTVYRLRLGAAEFWFNPDEGLNHRVATMPSSDEATAMIRGLAHPPLHYHVLRLLARVGEDPRTLRLPSLLCGLLAILALGWLGSVAGSVEGGPRGRVVGAWFGALAAALSPALALQSVTMRPYSGQVLALSLGLGAALRYRETGRTRWIVLGSGAFVAAALLVYTSYLVIGGVGIVFLGALLARRLSQRRALVLLCAALPILGVLAWSYVTHLGPHLIGGASQREAQETWLRTQYVADPVAGLTALRRAARHGFSGALLPFVLVPVALSVGLAVRRRRGFAALVALAVSGLAVALSWSGLVPLGASRHSLYLVPVLVAAGAGGAAWLAGRLSSPGAALPESLRRRSARLGIGVALAALLAGVVGTQVVLFLRASASRAIDAGDDERVVPRASIDAVSRFVRRARASFWITDMQTCMLLLPLVPREGRVLPEEPAFGGRRLEALDRSFAVVWKWALPVAPAGADDPVELALAWIAAQGGAADAPVGIVAGGWGTSAAWRLAQDLRARDPAGATVVEAAGDARLAAVVVDVAALRAWRAREAAAAAPRPAPPP